MSKYEPVLDFQNDKGVWECPGVMSQKSISPGGRNAEHLVEQMDGEQGLTRRISQSTRLEPEGYDVIVVGYVFGPKKMETMSVVMAEASKATTVYPCTAEATPLRILSHETISAANSRIRTTLPKHVELNLGVGEGDGQQQQKKQRLGLLNLQQFLAKQDGCFTNDTDAASESTGTCTASTRSTPLPTLASTASNAGTTSSVRVCFVPLDPEYPIEEQHGGRMDVILHKLTEDILCFSKLASQHPSLPQDLVACTDVQQLPTVAVAASQAALQRVWRLVHFSQCHPECSVVDHVMNVQTLMNRADIASRLQRFLPGLRSASGYRVISPRYVVLDESMDTVDACRQRLSQAGLSFPIIMKPLTAAGSKASHSMAILLDDRDLGDLLARSPCLCQEYLNHDAVLYKVYVLGQHVSVHKRRSLPNLPRGADSNKTVVEFDSQRPYPKLHDFGFRQGNEHRAVTSGKRPRLGEHPVPVELSVTEEEISPVVDTLKKAFGLELFGFDILVTPSGPDRRMLIVDVNYFPSYKEVHNFPCLLAGYLTDRALQARDQQREGGEV